MYTATAHYQFKDNAIDEAALIWKEEILDLAKHQPGFVRMQFLVQGCDALAIGNWESQKDAQAFMQTGIFVQLKKRLEALSKREPIVTHWQLKYFEQK